MSLPNKYQPDQMRRLIGWLTFILTSVFTINSDSQYIQKPLPLSNSCVIGTAHQTKTLQWRHNERDGVSNHQPYDCLLNRLFRRGSKKTSKLRVTGLCAGNSPVTGEFPTQRAVTRKIFPFDDVIMSFSNWCECYKTSLMISQHWFR